MLKKTPTICEGCSKGCNMEVQHEGNVIYRCIPRENMEINKYWMCDEGRMNYHYTQSQNRILAPMQGGTAVSWDDALQSLQNTLQEKRIDILVGSDLTLEEMKIVLEFASTMKSGASVYHFGTQGIEATSQDGEADAILKMKSKTSNLNGAEKLGIQSVRNLQKGSDPVLVIRGGRADLNTVKSLIQGRKSIGIGVFMNEEATSFSTILPGLSFVEKDGTIINHRGVEQKIRRALTPKNTVKAVSEIFMILANKKNKVVQS